MSGPGGFLLVDSPDTLAAGRAAGWLSKSFRPVPVTKSGLASCRGAGVAYTSIDAFHPREDLIAWTLEQFNRLERFCATFDLFLGERVPEVRDRALRLFKYSTYDMKIMTDVISVKLFHAMGLMNSAPEEIVYRSDRTPPPIDDRLTFPDEANLFAPALEALRRAIPWPGALRPLDVPLKSPRTNRWAGFLRTAKREARSCWKGLSALGAPRHFLEFQGTYDLEHTAPALRRLGYRPRRLPVDGAPDPAVAERFEAAWEALRGEPAFVNFFSVNGVGYFPLVENRMHHLIARVFPKAVAAYDGARRRILQRRPRPSFSLTGCVTVGAVARAQMKAGQDVGAPLVSYQEGSGFGAVSHPMNDFAEVNDGDLFLCYGEGNRSHRQGLIALGRPAKPFAVVGSAHQDVVHRRLTARAPSGTVARWMYVGTNVTANCQHHPYNGWTDTAYHETQCALFDFLDELPLEIEVRIKPHPADAVTFERFSKKGKRPYTVVRRPLERVLNGVDLFIVDFPSTTLLACCQTDGEVFVLAEVGAAHFDPVARASLVKRAHVFPDLPSLRDALRRVARGGSLEKKRDTEYVRLYARGPSDGRSAERAAAVLDSPGTHLHD